MAAGVRLFLMPSRLPGDPSFLRSAKIPLRLGLGMVWSHRWMLIDFPRSTERSDVHVSYPVAVSVHPPVPTPVVSVALQVVPAIVGIAVASLRVKVVAGD